MTEYHFFWGDKSSYPVFQKGPHSPRAFLKQIHSPTSVYRDKWNAERPEADGHWSLNPEVELCVYTADCLPILGYHSRRQIHFALHAGWRGVQSRALPHLMEQIFQRTQCSSAEWKIGIGPHIGNKSFELEIDVGAQLVKEAINEPPEKFFQAHRKGFGLFDLQAIVLKQLESCDVLPSQVTTTVIDTFTDGAFHSYRRDGGLKGQQVSSIRGNALIN